MKACFFCDVTVSIKDVNRLDDENRVLLYFFIDAFGL